MSLFESDMVHGVAKKYFDNSKCPMRLENFSSWSKGARFETWGKAKIEISFLI
jgi:hypothetical protein